MWVENMPMWESQIQFHMGIKSGGAPGSEILLLSRTQCEARGTGPLVEHQGENAL